MNLLALGNILRIGKASHLCLLLLQPQHFPLARLAIVKALLEAVDVSQLHAARFSAILLALHHRQVGLVLRQGPVGQPELLVRQQDLSFKVLNLFCHY
jgi:tRNA(Leu) C34 or U34 (ribose-2'-O)-methylase TrmL